MSYIFAHKELFPVALLGFVDPDDHYAYNGILTDDGEIRKYESFEELCQHIKQRRLALALPEINNLELKIQHYLYLIGNASKSHFIRTDQSPDDQIANIPRDLHTDIIVGANLALELSRQAVTGLFQAGASGWVTRTEAEERAHICINCPKNIPLRKSKFQKLNNKIAALFTLKRHTSVDDKLFDCGVCGCPNYEKVHFATSIILKITPPKYKVTDFPEGFIGLIDKERHQCWVRQILEEERK